MSYLPLCQLHLRHNYFNSGYLAQAELEPTTATLQKLRNAQLIYKKTRQGAVLLLDSARRDIAAACCEPPLTLHFLLFSTDSHFGSYTDPVLQRGQLWYCDSQTAVAEANFLRLHHQSTLGGEELLSADDNRLVSIIDQRHASLPQLVLALSINAAEVNAINASNSRNYLIKFVSRQTLWRYYLIGDSFSGALQIRDMNRHNAAIFARQQDVLLANGRKALVFDSIEPLNLAEQSPYRFGLISQDGGSEKILIKRLPVATAGQSGNAVVNGVTRHLAEIYLNY
jgi:hypothetical protein